MVQERIESNTQERYIRHRDSPGDIFVINMHNFHNAHLLRRMFRGARRALVTPVLLYADRQAQHAEQAERLRKHNKVKRTERSKRARTSRKGKNSPPNELDPRASPDKQAAQRAAGQTGRRPRASGARPSLASKARSRANTLRRADSANSDASESEAVFTSNENDDSDSEASGISGDEEDDQRTDIAGEELSIASITGSVEAGSRRRRMEEEPEQVQPRHKRLCLRAPAPLSD